MTKKYGTNLGIKPNPISSTLKINFTGTGCMTSSLVGCGVATGDVFWGTVAGIGFMGIAGEIAKENLSDKDGLGSYRVKLIDAISNLNDELINKYLKISRGAI